MTTIAGWSGATLAAGLVGLAALAVYDAVRLIRPPEYVHPRQDGAAYAVDPQKAFGLPFESVALETPNGDLLRGWLVRAGGRPDSPGTVVVAVHGRGGDRTQWLDLAPRLQRAAISVLLIDLRENGLSGGSGKGMTMGVREAEDVAIAARAMRSDGFSTVVALGCSLGGSAVLLATAAEGAISGVAADSAPADFPSYVGDHLGRRLNRLGVGAPKAATTAWGALVTRVAAAMQRIPVPEPAVDAIGAIGPRPVLVIAGSEDTDVSPDHARRLFASAGEPKELWTVPGAGHCGALSAAPDEFAAKIVELAARSRPGG